MDQETRVETMNRLRAEGRWVEATEFRVAEIKRHRAARMKRGEARRLAWEAMLAKYPPLPRYVDETGPRWDYPEGGESEGEHHVDLDLVDVEQLVSEWASEHFPQITAEAGTALELAIERALAAPQVGHSTQGVMGWGRDR